MFVYNGNHEGYVHSIETGGMVDGPGIRYVVFFSGCNLRCKYCHNPDTWKLKAGNLVTVEEVAKDIEKYKSYLSFSGGGVTITGGEPFVQPNFLRELLTACKARGLHTVLDTSGSVDVTVAEGALKVTDLLILDIKSINPAIYKTLTGGDLYQPLEILKLSEAMQIPTWIRYVLVPGYTDNMDDIKKTAKTLKAFSNIQKIEVLPFHKMGEYKWENLGREYELADVEPPSLKVLNDAKAILEK